MINFFFFLFFNKALCSLPSKPIHEVIQGNWNLTKIDLTDDGLENPDTIINFTFSLANPENNQTYFSDIYCLSSTDSLDDRDDESPQSHTLKLSFNFSSTNPDLPPENENFNLTLDDNFTITGELVKSIDGVRRSVGAIQYPLNASYTFTILSSYRAKLTLFDRDSGKVTIFRLMKEYDTGMFSGFGKYASYMMRKMVFRLI